MPMCPLGGLSSWLLFTDIVEFSYISLSSAHQMMCLSDVLMNPATLDKSCCKCRWYRDPSLPVPRSEITRFPHAVLEVKLSLPEGQQAPTWVQDLIDSGYLTEASAILQPPLSQFCLAKR